MSSAQFGSIGLPRRRSTAAGVHWWFGTSPETTGQGSRKRLVEMTGRATEGQRMLRLTNVKWHRLESSLGLARRPIPSAPEEPASAANLID
jgi:hypothetical protein